MDHELAPMSGLAATEPPRATPKHGIDTDTRDKPSGAHGFVGDPMGGKHPIGDVGVRLRQSSRPRGSPPEDWDTLNAADEQTIIADW